MMDADQVTKILGIGPADRVIIHETTAEVLWRDIEKSSELVALLQDDVFATRFNLRLQGHTIRRIESPVFMDASNGHVGEMIAELRGKGESYAIFHNGGYPIGGWDGGTDDLDQALDSIGWRVLSHDEERVRFLAPNLVRC